MLRPASSKLRHECTATKQRSATPRFFTTDGTDGTSSLAQEANQDYQQQQPPGDHQMTHVTNILLSDDEQKALKTFDMDHTFGPCMGLTRLQRWERADRFGLAPPHEVRAILERTNQDHQLAYSIWEKL